jgi:hypothetical protein
LILGDCSKDEELILVAILAIAKSLPKPLVEYTPALGQLSRYFKNNGGHPRGDHNPSPGSVAVVRRRK